ncbi:MAG TPA: sortase [Candidatus Limnocylindrales bacterium]|nr:sortase [Candidatus Limnocylindrales bacterium]
MPTATRSARSLVALGLIVNLLAASAPSTALGGQGGTTPAPPPVSRPAAASDVRLTAHSQERRDATAVERVTRALSLRADWIARPRAAVPQPKAAVVATKGAAKPTRTATTSTSFRGSNHLWIPSLGISRSTTFYSCSSSAYPGNRVYRWGCAGSNNVYLFGHAYSVFKPLHDAYVRGRLRTGMKAYYADASGRVRTYAVSWWKLTTPDKGDWAYASLARPSMTLQTCVGANSQYRLIVRLTRVG